ncbi:hypothetical protein MAP00_006017 [Monascus purpureus]|nr:hypothetical protein MAP00_006017 [Monascus purpureus]
MRSDDRENPGLRASEILCGQSFRDSINDVPAGYQYYYDAVIDGLLPASISVVSAAEIRGSSSQAFVNGPDLPVTRVKDDWR